MDFGYMYIKKKTVFDDSGETLFEKSVSPENLFPKTFGGGFSINAY